jgi:hypothetical protein
LEKTESKLVVHYVDYGNCDTVEPGSLLAIPQDLCRLPATALRFRLEGQSLEDDVKSRESMELLLTSLPCISLCYSTIEGELVGQLRHGELATTDENMNVKVPADKQSQGSAPADQYHVSVNSIHPAVGKAEGAAAGVRES